MGKDRDLVIIRWVDARFCPGLHTEDEVMQHTPDIFDSSGYIIGKTNLCTYLVRDPNDKGEWRDILLIPNGSIISITKQGEQMNHNKQ